MMRYSCRLSRALCVVMWIAAACAGPHGRGEDDTIVDDTGGFADQPQQQGMALIDLGANWDNNLFNGLLRHIPAAPGNAQTESIATTFIREHAARKMRRLEAACGLTSEQRHASELALDMDTTRLIEDFEEKRRKYVGRKVNVQSAEGRRELQLMQRDVTACTVRLRNQNAGFSLFAGVLVEALDETQRQRVDAESRAHRRLVWETIVATEMVQFDDMFSLSHAQHEAMERLLLDREPALVVDEWMPGPRHLHDYQMLVYAALADIGRKPLREIVDKRFWAQLDGLVNQGTGAQRWVEEQALIQTGGR